VVAAAVTASAPAPAPVAALPVQRSQARPATVPAEAPFLLALLAYRSRAPPLLHA
jgi:hypothetical protein